MKTMLGLGIGMGSGSGLPALLGGGPVARAAVAVCLMLVPLAVRASDPEPPRVPATDMSALQKLVGQEARVFGKIDRVRDWSGLDTPGRGANFLNFHLSSFTVVAFERSYKNFAKKPVELYKDRHIEVRGKVALYQGKLQIVLEKPEQVKILPDPEPEPDGEEDQKDGSEGQR